MPCGTAPILCTGLHPQEFEKKEARVRARAATNLAFLHMLEAHTDVAERYAELALSSDRYNARAYVNKVSATMSTKVCATVSTRGVWLGKESN